jgi:membrane protein required for beta-lactamase induction
MALISVIIALILDRLLRDYHDLRDLNWFEYYSGVISRLLPLDNAGIKLFCILLLPLGLIALIQYALHDWLFGLPYFMFGVMVLIYCLGPACLASDIEAYLDARSLGDSDEAMHYAGVLTEHAASTVPDQQTADVTRAILFAANQRIFSVLLWFVLLGPVGAVCYRFIANLARQYEADAELTQLASKLYAQLAWLPARMLAVGYALMGSFEGAYHGYKDCAIDTDLDSSNFDVLVTTGLGAIKDYAAHDEVSSIHAARALVMRAVLLWVTVLALLTLGGWLG